MSSPFREQSDIIHSDLSGGSFAESTSGGRVSSGVLQSSVVDVGELAVPNCSGTFRELAGLELHLGVVELGNVPYVPESENGFGKEIEDTVED